MKTFETERLDIPVGATHYRNECNEFDFAWVKYTGDHTLMVDESITSWTEIDDRYFEAGVKPIQLSVLENQMNIDNLATQTPEKKEVEWVNGDKCTCQGREWQFVSILSEYFHSTAVLFDVDTEELRQVPVASLSKPETEAERVERERLEAAYDLYLTRHLDMNAPYQYNEFLKNEFTLNGFLAIVDKTNYRKEG